LTALRKSKPKTDRLLGVPIPIIILLALLHR
jgi:hypothetical protein